jgi:hypothetical protein
MAQDHHLRRIGAIVALVKQAARRRRYPQHVEGIGRRPRACESLGDAVGGQARAPIRISRDASGNENGALGLSGRTDAIHTSRSGDEKGNARTSTVFTTENTAVVAPTVSASVHTTVNAKPGRRT